MKDDKIDELLQKHGIKYPSCGFSIGDGWLSIVDEAFEKMIEAGWDRDLQQVKEKFCGLRIYIGNGSEAVDVIIRDAERKAALCCENCGRSHGLRVPRCGAALCPKCKGKET